MNPLHLSIALVTVSVAVQAQSRVPVTSSAAGRARVSAASPSPSQTVGTSTLIAPPSNDSCSTPTAVVGFGPFPFDTTAATTGSEGQSEARCTFFGPPSVPFDVWYCWTAPSSGSFDVTTLGLTTAATKIAVYEGCGCPLNPALSCNDHSCDTSQGTATFLATAGLTYTIQLGVHALVPGGSGAFAIQPTPFGGGCRLDDGSSEFGFGLGVPGTICWLQTYGSIGTQALVTQVSGAFGSLATPGFGPPVGRAVDVLVWEDPTDDRDPSDAVLLYQGTGAVSNVDNDVLDVFPVTPTIVNGIYFVGLGMAASDTEFPAAFDDNLNCVVGATGWAVADSPGPVDYTNLANPAYAFPLLDITIAAFGRWVLRADCTTSASTSFCGNGDPNRMPCPCGNDGANSVGGCANSLPGSTGAKLTTSGFQATDNVVLRAERMSGQTCVFFATSGPAQTGGAVFGDGITCTGGALIRLATVNYPLGSGTAEFPGPSQTVTLSSRTGTFPGSGAVFQYGCYYRNAASFCTPSTFNTTDTEQIVW